MRTTIDKAGRVVIPLAMREQIGLVPGAIDVHVVGNAIQIEVVDAEVELIEEDGFLMIQGNSGLTDEELRTLRLELQDPVRRRGESGE